ncbi:MAG: hypothetical protein ACTS4U_00610 [Candidatus Hodgkinia cicadicola]
MLIWSPCHVSLGDFGSWESQHFWGKSDRRSLQIGFGGFWVNLTFQPIGGLTIKLVRILVLVCKVRSLTLEMVKLICKLTACYEWTLLRG